MENKSVVFSVRVSGRLAELFLECMNDRALTRNEMMHEMISFYLENLAEPPTFVFDFEESAN